MAPERYFERRQVRQALDFARAGGIAFHRNLDIYDGRVSARGWVMRKPFLHVIGSREQLLRWAAGHGIPPQAIQPEKNRGVAHIDVFGEMAESLIERFQRLDRLRENFRELGRASSELYARLAAGVAEALAQPEPDHPVVRLALAVPPGQSAGLLLLGAVHLLVLRGVGHGLAQYYASAGEPARPPDGELWETFEDFCGRHQAALLAEIQRRRLQTNEVQRSAVILPPLAMLARQSGRPLALLEVGCSAGLNLVPDRYAYDYGDGAVGDQRAPLLLRCRLKGSLRPPTGIPPIAWRVGLDLNPIDATDPDQALWLRALIWPDQPWRAEALLAAVRAVQAAPVPIVAGDAATALAGVAAEAPADAELVVCSTFALYQFDGGQRAAYREQLDRIAARRPVHHLTVDWIPGATPYAELETLAPGTEPVRRRLAAVDPHGTWMEWLEPESAEWAR